jgi:putative ABC transport system ATP-binding protein
MAAVIEASHLGKIYRSGKLEVHALRDATFSVESGEFLSIVGPSGSGKSTLFYILGGLTSASAGSLRVAEQDFSRMSDTELTRFRRGHIGFIFQRFNLLPTLSARDNIELAHTIAGTGRPFDRPLLDKLAEMLRIESRLDHRPNELSGGEQQRIAIARALITRPSIVLADEPTGNLDTENSESVLTMLRESSRELGQTVLMITHNPEAAVIADRILYMRDGRTVGVEAGQGRAAVVPAATPLV